jgi:hypothetical protein
MSKLIESILKASLDKIEEKIDPIIDKIDKKLYNLSLDVKTQGRNPIVDSTFTIIEPPLNLFAKCTIKLVEDSIFTNKIISFVLKNDKDLKDTTLDHTDNSYLNVLSIIKLQRINDSNLNLIFEIFSQKENYKVRKNIFNKILSHKNCSTKLKKRIESFQLLR